MLARYERNGGTRRGTSEEEISLLTEYHHQVLAADSASGECALNQVLVMGAGGVSPQAPRLVLTLTLTLTLTRPRTRTRTPAPALTRTRALTPAPAPSQAPRLVEEFPLSIPLHFVYGTADWVRSP